jgi:hypothetical protein
LNERSKNDRRENELRVSAAAAEARSSHKQTSNDEGTARDLQIYAKWRRAFTAQCRTRKTGGWSPVNVQDKGAVIERFPGHPPELKWDK